MSDVLIALKDLTKKYKSHDEEVLALRGVTPDISKGESVAVMGQSGSGNTSR